MTDKKPVKRGVLSGLMGLFGEENADGQPIAASSPCRVAIACAMYFSRSMRFSSSMPAMRL